MKAVILSAGQGKRLLPLTTDRPKCLLPVRGRSLIEWQIGELAKCGINQVTTVLGFRADKVERLLRERYDSQRVKTIYNDAYAVSDNLVSCWTAHDEMNSDFVLLNGDTLFEAAVLKSLLDTHGHQVTVVVSHKDDYDTDDMKVELDGGGLPTAIAISVRLSDCPPVRLKTDEQPEVLSESDVGSKAVESILETWHIDDEWWREPISRRYMPVVSSWVST